MKNVSLAVMLVLFLQSLAIPVALAQPDAPSGPIANGDFETGDISGWMHIESGSGNWSTYSGTVSPWSNHTIAAPPQGLYAATTDQNAPGSQLLYQDVVVPTGTNATLSFLVYLENRAGVYYAPESFAFNGSPNQQFRVDVLRTNASPDSLAAGDILATPFRTLPGDPTSVPPSRVCFPLTAYEGEPIRLRFAVVENQYFFQGSIDDVQITSECTPSSIVRTEPDLAVVTMAATSPVVEGERANVHLSFRNFGGAANASFAVEMTLDGAPFFRRTYPAGLPASWNESLSAVTPPLHGGGTHVIRGFLDIDGNVTESNETNNDGVLMVHVTPQADVAIAGLELRPVYVPTEAGPVRHPLGRHEATMTACNAGSTTSRNGTASFAVTGGHGNASLSVGSANVRLASLPALAPGQCVQHQFQFDTPGIVGDFTLRATIDIPHDSPSGNVRTAQGFRLVGDQGGVVLPIATMAPIEPGREAQSLILFAQAAPGEVLRAANGVLANASAFAQQAVRTANNTTSSAERAVNNAPDAIGRLVDSGARSVFNTTDAARQTLTTTVNDTVNAIQQQDADGALDFAGSTTCAGSAQLCNATRGDPRVGVFRPCATEEMRAEQNLPAFLLWYGVHAYEQRALFRPESRPLNQNWPVPYTPLPIPEEAPALCRNLWDDAREVAAAAP